MTSLPPRTHLGTHEVFNQPTPLEDVNLYDGDQFLRRTICEADGKDHEAALSALGAQAGSAEAVALGVEANRNPPQLRSFDRFGQRLDEVVFHPAYHRLMRMGWRPASHPAPGPTRKAGMWPMRRCFS